MSKDLADIRGDLARKETTFEDEEQTMRANLDIVIIDNAFAKFYKNSEVLSGVLNPKVCKAKNQEFKLKLDAWKKRKQEMNRQKTRLSEKRKEIRVKLHKYLQIFEMTPEVVQECILEYEDAFAELNKRIKDERVIFEYLSKLPDNILTL